jgi:hypothetical protein
MNDTIYSQIFRRICVLLCLRNPLQEELEVKLPYLLNKVPREEGVSAIKLT